MNESPERKLLREAWDLIAAVENQTPDYRALDDWWHRCDALLSSDRNDAAGQEQRNTTGMGSAAQPVPAAPMSAREALCVERGVWTQEQHDVWAKRHPRPWPCPACAALAEQVGEADWKREFRVMVEDFFNPCFSARQHNEIPHKIGLKVIEMLSAAPDRRKG